MIAPYRSPPLIDPCPAPPIEPPEFDWFPVIYALSSAMVAMALAAMLGGCDEPCTESMGAIDLRGNITHSCYSARQKISIEVVNGTSFWHCSCLVKDGGR